MKEPEKGFTRRQFMRLASGVITALIGLGLTIPALAYIIGPALRREEEQDWIPLGSASKVELGSPTLFRARVQRQTGWITTEEQITAYVLTEDGRTFVALSNICTHLGCRVRWVEEEASFYCPCHNGVFDKQGNVVSGPVPRPLDRFQTKFEEGRIFVRGG